MLKNCNKKNKKSKNNKGFTLVELVVVIAILAILVGLLVPQYTKYVDKARKSSDASNLANMVRAVEIAAADPNGTLKPETNIKITINKTNTTVTAPTNEANVKAAIKNTMGDDALNTIVKSTNWKNNTIEATITIKDDYSFIVTYSDDVTEYIEGSKKTETETQTP